jgi:hypothetical protein
MIITTMSTLVVVRYLVRFLFLLPRLFILNHQATHSSGKDGGLEVNEARLVMQMTRFKKLEDEHHAHLDQVRLSDDDEDDDDEDGGGEYSSSEDEAVMVHKDAAAQANRKAAGLEKTHKSLNKRVRDLEKVKRRVDH